MALRGARPTGSITQIRVDSEVSLAGGRELWGIPKELASLGFSAGPGFTARTDEDWIATAAAGFDIAQTLGGRVCRSPVHATARPHLAAADRSVIVRGPLGYLDGLNPVTSVELRDVRIRFGG